MTPLFAFLNRQLAVPFVWGGFDGGSDCCLFMADWVWFLRGSDPAGEIRFCYDSPAACHRLTGWFRDPVAVVDPICASAALSRVAEPVRGDVALVRVDGQTVGAICTGKAWAMKAEGRGVNTRAAGTVEVVAAWGVGYAD